MLNTYELEWNGPSIYNEVGDGLWDNKSKIAIHIPILKKKFKIFKECKEFKMEDFVENFYIQYYNETYIERMNFSYFELNDLVFNNNVYNGFKKNKFYTTLNLNIE
tara:strand:+ start:3790 stop:4107 length:318 start_codon:yes stop_codon:yes gene_type:complete